MTFVVDASFLASVYLPDEAVTSAQRELFTEAFDAEVIVPAHFRAAMANAFLVAERRKRWTPAAADDAWSAFSKLLYDVEPPPEGRTMRQCIRLARAHELTIYDAIYLELAVRRHGMLVSRDHALVRAAAAAGLPIGD